MCNYDNFPSTWLWICFCCKNSQPQMGNFSLYRDCSPCSVPGSLWSSAAPTPSEGDQPHTLPSGKMPFPHHWLQRESESMAVWGVSLSLSAGRWCCSSGLVLLHTCTCCSSWAVLQLLSSSAALSWCSLTHQGLNCCPDALCTGAGLTHSHLLQGSGMHHPTSLFPASLWSPLAAQPAALLRVGTWVRLSARTWGAGVSQTNGSGPCVCSLCSRKSLAGVWKVCAGLCFHCLAAVSKPHLGMVYCCSISVFLVCLSMDSI